jgi:fatty acid desaturase
MNHRAKKTGSIPDVLNFAVVGLQLTAMAACIAQCRRASGWSWIVLGTLFVLVLNSIYFAIHEAEHGLLFSDRVVNGFAGTLLAVFLPASYAFIRSVHLAHHVHNRSDDEVFDFYFEEDPVFWKKLQFFGILTGGFWLTLVLGNIVLAIMPTRWLSRAMAIDRPSAAVMRYVGRRNQWRIRGEALVVLVVHSGIVWWLGRQAIAYGVLYLTFGMSWSTLQYVHHYGTCRDVLRGAKNLRYGWPLDMLWLNHGWHLTHHLHPTVSWLYLRQVAGENEPRTEALATAYLKMWRGPLLTVERVQNRYDGNVVQP